MVIARTQREGNHALPVAVFVGSMALLGLCVAQASGTPVHFSGTDHYYEVISHPNIDWADANNEASAMTYIGNAGYLVTITSAEENTCVTSLMGGVIYDAWAGGYQPDGSSEPADGWRWVTPEPWSYANWNYGEPNNNGDEKVLQIFASDNPSFPYRWNDLHGTTYPISGYVVEYGLGTPDPTVPEPVTMVALLGGIGCLGGYLRRRQK